MPNVTFEVSQCENLLGYLRIELGSAVNSDGLNTYYYSVVVRKEVRLLE